MAKRKLASRRRTAGRWALLVLVSLVSLELSLRALGFVIRLTRSGAADGKAGVILCVGDSFTFGMGASREESYPAQLQRLLERDGYDFAVVNEGVPGSNSTQLLKALPDLARKHRPRIVVVMTGHNDGNTAESNVFLFTGGRSLPELARRAQFFANRSRVYQLAALAGGRLRDLVVRTGAAGPASAPEDEREAALGEKIDEALRRGETSAAFALADEWLGSRPGSRFAAQKRIEVLAKQKRFDEALRESEELIRREPAYVPPRLTAAWMHWLFRDYEKSFAHWEQVLELDPGNADARHGLSFKWQVRTPYDVRTAVLRKVLHYNLRQAAAAVRPAKFVVMSYPYTDAEKNESRAKAAADAGGLYVDNKALFDGLLKTAEPRRYFSGDEPEILASHCSAAGYGAIAENLYARLRAAGYIEGRPE